jgi:hypothetical protein
MMPWHSIALPEVEAWTCGTMSQAACIISAVLKSWLTCWLMGARRLKVAMCV